MSSVDELHIITTKLAEYFTNISLNLDSTANSLPSFEDYIDFIIYDSILTDAQQGSDRAASFSTGALVDTVHLAAGLEREFEIRTKSKGDYFLEGEEDTDNAAIYIAELYGKYLNYYRGTSPEQAKE